MRKWVSEHFIETLFIGVLGLMALYGLVRVASHMLGLEP